MYIDTIHHIHTSTHCVVATVPCIATWCLVWHLNEKSPYITIQILLKANFNNTHCPWAPGLHEWLSEAYLVGAQDRHPVGPVGWGCNTQYSFWVIRCKDTRCRISQPLQCTLCVQMKMLKYSLITTWEMEHWHCTEFIIKTVNWSAEDHCNSTVTCA